MNSPAQRDGEAGNRVILRTIGQLLFPVARHWLLVFTLVYGVFVTLPFLAPVFMHIGWSGAGKGIYILYFVFCHQLPQRSFFLFGPQGMYSLAEVQAAWVDTLNPLILRQFVGSPEIGWKVAWSDRMVSMYTIVLPLAWGWWWVRRRLKPLSWWGLVLFLLPMVVDGGTHLISDLSGIGQGFRDSNDWLAALTGNAFPAAFYAGDALGSFNSWMRLLTGVLFGLGVVWFGFPYLERLFDDVQPNRAEAVWRSRYSTLADEKDTSGLS